MLINRVLQALAKGMIRRHAPTPKVRLRVTNLTRGNVLATCLEVADQGESRRKGLLGRDHLSPGEGLWILPCEAVHTFWMKFSIDLVYLNRKNQIRKLRSNMPPWRLSSCFSAHSVLELAPGTICGTQTQRGDILEFTSAPRVNVPCDGPSECA